MVFLLKKRVAKLSFSRNTEIKILMPAIFYLFKVNNRNTKKECKTCSMLLIKTPVRRQNGQTQVKNLAEFVQRCLSCV